MRRTIPHPDPRLASRGVSAIAAPAALIKPDRAGKATRSPLTDIFPHVSMSIDGGFADIPVPAGTLSSLPTGFSAYYPLIDLSVDQLGQELLLFGFDLTAESTHANATGNDVIWGDTKGRQAAIVIGDGNLPITGKTTWTAGPSSIPGLEATTSIVQSSSGRVIDYQTFPPGSQADAIPFKVDWSRRYSPWVYRFPFGSRLQAALVVRGSQIQAGAGASKTLRGSAIIRLRCGLTVTPTGLTS